MNTKKEQSFGFIPRENNGYPTCQVDCSPILVSIKRDAISLASVVQHTIVVGTLVHIKYPVFRLRI